MALGSGHPTARRRPGYARAVWWTTEERLRTTISAALFACLLGCRGSAASRPDSGDGRAAVVDASVSERPDFDASPVDAAGAPVDAAAAFACLAEHYAGRAVRTGATWSLELPDGSTVAWDDGKPKTTAARIASPDVEDVFALGYPTGPIVPVTDAEEDPGRVRLEPLFRATYGATEREVSAALTSVKIAGHSVRFHRRAAPALERVARRIEVLLRAEPELGRFFRALGGTFAVRTIAGTARTSAHAWGIAIDIDTSMSDYWRSSPKSGWRNRIPASIVEAFESEGFVWGGRWFHYDTKHFEYRPELFDPRCRAPLSSR